MNHLHLFYWLAALYMPGVGPHKLMRWLTQFPSIQDLFNATEDELEAKGFSKKIIYLIKHPNAKVIDEDLKWAQQTNCHMLCFDDEAYPASLKEIADPPFVLYVKGNLAALSEWQIAMVGSRRATPTGIKNAEKFAAALVEAGLAITSGLATGIDGASHRGALAARGITIGVAGTGLNHCYPAVHQSLIEEIVQQQGAILSEFPLATPPKPMNFPRRNRIIGGLSLGVLVIEAALKSGSLITAKHALEQGREVFAIPGSIHHPLARGCHYLIRQGAKLVETAQDVLEEFRAISSRKGPANECGLKDIVLKKKQKENFHVTIPPEYRSVLEQIGYEMTPLDVVILGSGLTAGEVSSTLLTLELNGYIQSVPGGYIRVLVNQ